MIAAADTPRSYVVRFLPDCPETGAEYAHPSRRETATHEDAERFAEAEAYAVAHAHRARFPGSSRRCMVEHLERPGPAMRGDDYDPACFDTPGPWPPPEPPAAAPKQGELFAGAAR